MMMSGIMLLFEELLNKYVSRFILNTIGINQTVVNSNGIN